MKMEFTIENLILDISSYLQIKYDLNIIPEEIKDSIIEHSLSLIDKQLDKRRSENTRQQFKKKLLSNIKNQLKSYIYLNDLLFLCFLLHSLCFGEVA